MAKTPAPPASTTVDPSSKSTPAPPKADDHATKGTQTTPPTKAPPAGTSKVRRVFELIGVGLMAAGLGVGGTWLWWMLRTNNLVEEHQTELQQAKVQQQTQLTELRGRLDARTTDVLLLDAHRWLHRCVLALDKHNFGTAREHAKQAAQRLQQAAQRLEGQADHSPVVEAQQALQRISPEVSADVGGQRTKFLAVAEQLNSLLKQRMSGQEG